MSEWVTNISGFERSLPPFIVSFFPLTSMLAMRPLLGARKDGLFLGQGEGMLAPPPRWGHLSTASEVRPPHQPPQPNVERREEKGVRGSEREQFEVSRKESQRKHRYTQRKNEKKKKKHTHTHTERHRQSPHTTLALTSPPCAWTMRRRYGRASPASSAAAAAPPRPPVAATAVTQQAGVVGEEQELCCLVHGQVSHVRRRPTCPLHSRIASSASSQLPTYFKRSVRRSAIIRWGDGFDITEERHCFHYFPHSQK